MNIDPHQSAISFVSVETTIAALNANNERISTCKEQSDGVFSQDDHIPQPEKR